MSRAAWWTTGEVADVAGTTNDDPGFDAAVVMIAP
jgi:hypothetical protein